MKNLILSALLAVIVAASAFAAGENKISSVVLNSFKIDFRQAQDVSWSSNTGYAKAAFTLNARRMEVFYSSAGDIIASSTSIELNELPVGAKRAFAKRYTGYTVNEAIKFEAPTETSYYLSAENEKENIILKVNEAEQLFTFRKSKKSK
jgi:hypothetical protein